MEVDLGGLKNRAHTPNFKNEVRRCIRPTNVLFNGIPCIYQVSTESAESTVNSACKEEPYNVHMPLCLHTSGSEVYFIAVGPVVKKMIIRRF